jgi:hypothetical protein
VVAARQEEVQEVGQKRWLLTPLILNKQQSEVAVVATA